MNNRSAEDVAKFLAEIYGSEFGGKEHGRYKISRSNLRRLSGRKRLEATTVSRIIDEALDLGYIVVEVGDYFCVVEEGVMLNFRPVPKSVLSRFIKGEPGTRASDEED